MSDTKPTVIITGATGLLAWGVIKSLSQAGHLCLCQYRSTSARAGEIFASPNIVLLDAQIDSEQDIAGLFAKTKGVCLEKHVELPRVLINMAASFEKAPLGQVEFDQASRTMSVNAVAGLIMAKYFTAMLAGSGDVPLAKIINFADIAAIRPWANYSVYSASKAALVAITQSLAKELAPNMTVNAIAPGIIGPGEVLSDDEIQRQVERIPLKRFGNVREIVSAVNFILENDYVTGQVLCIDGGRSL